MAAPTTIPAMFDASVRHWGARTAVIDERNRVSYQELDALSLAIARSLLALGVGRGEMVLGLMRNRVEWIACFLGCARIGATYVPLNTWYTAAEIAWTLRSTRASVVISEPSFLQHDYALTFAGLEPVIARSAPGEIRGRQLPDLRALVYLTRRSPGHSAGSPSWNSGVTSARPQSLSVPPASRPRTRPSSFTHPAARPSRRASSSRTAG